VRELLRVTRAVVVLTITVSACQSDNATSATASAAGEGRSVASNSSGKGGQLPHVGSDERSRATGPSGGSSVGADQSGKGQDIHTALGKATQPAPAGAAGSTASDAGNAASAANLPSSCLSAVCGLNGTDSCSTDHRFCDATRGCSSCRTDAECPHATPYCMQGSCFECRTSADCSAASPACHPDAHSCQRACSGMGNECSITVPSNDLPVPTTYSMCDKSSGACVGCLSDSDCINARGYLGEKGTAPICDQFTRQCKQCVSDADCPAKLPRCFPRTGFCGECLTNCDCAASAPLCQKDYGIFRCTNRGCTDDSQCGSNQRCRLELATCAEKP
jgi:hypothetical protein